MIAHHTERIRHRLAAKCAAMMSVCIWAPNMAADEPKPADAPTITSNQGVTLERPAEKTLPAAGDPETHASPSQPDSEMAPRTVEAEATKLPARTMTRGRQAATVEAAPADSTPPWWRTTLGSLAIVLCLVGLLYAAVKRWAPSARAAEHGVLRVVARTSLTPKHGAALIQLGQRFVLVGFSPNQVQTLCEVTDTEEAAELALRAGMTSSGGQRGFGGLLREQSQEFGAGLQTESNDGGMLPHRRLKERPVSTKAVGDLLRRLRTVQSS